MEMYKPDPARLTEFWKTLQDLWLALFGSKVATVAAINVSSKLLNKFFVEFFFKGHSPAGGCLLACSCEYRIMVDNDKYSIGLNETKLGIVAPPWFVSTYQNVLPKRVAEGALIAGTLFPVKRALAVGLIDELAADKADALNKANLWLSQFAKIPRTHFLSSWNNVYFLCNPQRSPGPWRSNRSGGIPYNGWSKTAIAICSSLLNSLRPTSCRKTWDCIWNRWRRNSFRHWRATACNDTAGMSLL